MCAECRRPLSDCACRLKAVPIADGVVRVSRQTKGRGGISVTLIKGLALDPAALALLGKQLRTACVRHAAAAEQSTMVSLNCRETTASRS